MRRSLAASATGRRLGGDQLVQSLLHRIRVAGAVDRNGIDGAASDRFGDDGPAGCLAGDDRLSPESFGQIEDGPVVVCNDPARQDIDEKRLVAYRPAAFGFSPAGWYEVAHDVPDVARNVVL